MAYSNNKKVYIGKLGDISGQDIRKISMTSNTLRTTQNMQHTSWTCSMSMENLKTPWVF
jgi:hypothetical protein